MGCRCNERRIAIADGLRAVARGESGEAAEQARYVVKTTGEDAASLLRAKIAAAAARLSRR